MMTRYHIGNLMYYIPLSWDNGVEDVDYEDVSDDFSEDCRETTAIGKIQDTKN